MIKVWALIFSIYPGGAVSNNTIVVAQIATLEECGRVAKELSKGYSFTIPNYKCIEYLVRIEK